MYPWPRNLLFRSSWLCRVRPVSCVMFGLVTLVFPSLWSFQSLQRLSLRVPALVYSVRYWPWRVPRSATRIFRSEADRLNALRRSMPIGVMVRQVTFALSSFLCAVSSAPQQQILWRVYCRGRIGADLQTPCRVVSWHRPSRVLSVLCCGTASVVVSR